jgi:hypothetical protein
MTNTNESPISVTFKAGTAQYAPQITVRGDTGAEFLSRLLELNPEVSEGLDNNDPITNAIAVFQASWIETWALAAKALEGTVAPSNGGGGQRPAGGAAAATGSGTNADGRKVETDKFDNTYEFNHPQAPDTPYGPAVLKRWTQRDGKKRANWVDPRTAPSGYGQFGTIADDDRWGGKWGKDAKGV